MPQLAAQDAEDLQVISAHMQDAVMLLGDMRYDRKRRRFALLANRFAWERQPGNERRRSGLHFDHVLSVERLKIRQTDPEGVLSLLSMAFEEKNAPGGIVTLTFAGGGAIRLTVDSIDAALNDLGPAWAAQNQPDHGQ
jgi:Protein of unknown function (DUF2948)